MPKLDKTGPKGEGKGSGRKLGSCNPMSKNEKLQQLGKGMGMSRNSKSLCGQGRRLNAGIQTENVERRQLCQE
jgi:hypothetical protein